jgi:hypothetical protein
LYYPFLLYYNGTMPMAEERVPPSGFPLEESKSP